LLIVSFGVLVFTGFMLAFPDAFWVRGLVAVFGSAVGILRGPVHRVAAVFLVGLSIYHVGYRLFTERGRSFARDIRMRRTDVRDMFTVLRHNLGRKVSKPIFGQFSYVEKVEYWSVVWGTAIMAVTGVALWFESRFMGWFSKLFVDACDTIHYMEAWLALLAILVWHFYAVMFDPDVSPMNVTWITGMREEEHGEAKNDGA
jgi:cytochrome b subunit of formate dehydrogenase